MDFALTLSAALMGDFIWLPEQTGCYRILESGITRTNNQNELAELYSGASVFVNPTYQDNYPTTNLEAISCGTPVITYNTGGSPESLNKRTGIIVPKGSINKVAKCINESINMKKRIFLDCDCGFNKENCFNEYIYLYKELIKDEDN